MTKLQKYILIEFCANFFVAWVILTGFMTAANLLRPLREGFGILLVARFFHLYFPIVLTWTVPISVLTAALTAFAKLTETGELTAIQSAGIHVGKLMLPCHLLVFISLFPLVYLNGLLIPKCRNLIKASMVELAHDLMMSRLESGERNLSIPPYNLYVDRVENGQLLSIAIRAALNEQESVVIRARSARFEDEARGNERVTRLLMQDGTTTVIEATGKAGGLPGASSPPPPRVWTWDSSRMTLIGGGSGGEFQGSKTLSDLIPLTRGQVFALPKDDELRKNVILLHKRLSLSFASLVFVLVGAPLGMLSRKSNRLFALAASLALCGLYYLIFLAGMSLSKRAMLPPWLGLWSPNLFFAALAVWLSKTVVKA